MLTETAFELFTPLVAQDENDLVDSVAGLELLERVDDNGLAR